MTILIKIGELAKLSETTVETIRYYEKEQLLPIAIRSESNYRLYNASHVERLQFILHCRALDLTLAEIRILLEYWDTPNKDCGNVNRLIDEHIHAVEVKMRKLAQLKCHLTALREQCNQEADAKSCGILNALADSSCHE